MNEQRALPFDKAWVETVKTSLASTGRNPAWLAIEVGTSRSTISAILRMRVETSEFVQRIAEVLGIPGPGSVLPRTAPPIASDQYEHRMVTAVRMAKEVLVVRELEALISGFEDQVKALVKPPEAKTSMVPPRQHRFRARSA